MSVRLQSLKGSALLTAGEAVIYGASFVRNMLLARLLTKSDFGVAATFAMVIALLEFTGRLGISRFVIRDKDGGEPEFIAAAHLMQFVTGVVSALLIAACSAPLATLFGLEQHRWTLLVLAVVPLLNGLQHLDVRRFERDLRFGPSTLTEIIPQLAITLAAWPVAHWLGDFRAMLVLLLGKSLMSYLSSHGLAEQPYRWRWHREYMARMLRFGWPLLVTGFLMFGTLQGDQFLVATFYTMADLGPYAAAAALTMAPSFVFGRIFNSVMLPLMARVQDDPAAFARRYQQATAVITAFAATCSAGMIVGSEALMVLVYGPQYAGAGLIMAWLASANAFRILRIAPTLAALAKGDSKNQMISNLWRVTALIPSLYLALAHSPVWMLASTGLLGEILACRAAWSRLHRRDGVPVREGLKSALWVGMAGAISMAAAHSIREWSAFPSLSLAILGASAFGIAIILTQPLLRSETTEAARRIRRYLSQRRTPSEAR